MTEVVVGDSESFESALRRFNKKVQQEGYPRRSPPSRVLRKAQRNRKKKAAARRRKAMVRSGR